MMKKLLLLALCALLLASPALAEAAPLTLEDDMGLYVGGEWFPILNDFTALKDALGEPDEMIAAPSCVFKGDDKEFRYDGLSIYTNPLGDMDVWFEAYITGGDTVTARGIGIGASQEDVIAAYGDGFYSEGEGMMTYNTSGDANDYASPCVIFTLENGAVSCIDIYYPTNTL